LKNHQQHEDDTINFVMAYENASLDDVCNLLHDMCYTDILFHYCLYHWPVAYAVTV